MKKNSASQVEYLKCTRWSSHSNHRHYNQSLTFLLANVSTAVNKLQLSVSPSTGSPYYYSSASRTGPPSAAAAYDHL